MSSIYFSQYYDISINKEQDDWFDPRMTLDTKLCIDPFLIFKSDHPYFGNAKQKFIDFFQAAYSLATDPLNHDLLIQHSLAAGEVKELCLGFSTTGIGRDTRDTDFSAKITRSLSLLDRSNPEIFKAIEIFTPGIGKDKVSDAIANIIKRELIEYTMAVCERHPEIETGYFPIKNVVFNHKDGTWDDQCFYLPKNPNWKKTAVILVPKAFLRTIQSISSDELSNYLTGRSDEELRALLNNFLGRSIQEENKKTIDDFRDKLKKGSRQVISEIVEKYPDLVTEFLKHVEDSKDIYTAYDFEKDPDCLYTLPREIYGFTSNNPLPLSASNEHEFVSCMREIIAHFNYFINEHNGYKLFLMEDNQSPAYGVRFRDENSAQTIFRLFVSFYCKSNNIQVGQGDAKAITRLGEKPVEFTFHSTYKNKALIKLKLFPNIKFDKEALEDELIQLRENLVNFFCYITLLYYTPEFEQMREKLEGVKSVDTKGVQFKPFVINASQDRTATFIFNPEYMLEEQEVCISYAHKNDGEKYVNKLCEVLKAEGIKYVRDSEELKYKNNLREFMGRLGRGKCIVAVISDKYLKSDYCMDEMRQANKNGGLRDRIVPVVMADAGRMYDPIKALAYLKYWKERAEELETELKQFSSANTKGERYYSDLFADIERNISEIIDLLRNLIVDQVDINDDDELESLDFTDVLGEIKEILSRP
jgi:TIR domain